MMHAGPRQGPRQHLNLNLSSFNLSIVLPTALKRILFWGARVGGSFLVPENVLLPEYSPPSSLIYGLVSIPSFPLIFKGTFLGFRKPLFFFFSRRPSFQVCSKCT